MLKTAISKRNQFIQNLQRVHPEVADLARLVDSRKSSVTSMLSLASRMMTLLQKIADSTPPEEVEQTLHDHRSRVLQVADWAAATGDEWRPLVTLEGLYAAAEVWHDRLAEEADDTVEYVEEDPVEYEFEDGWTIVRLLAENAEAEGEIMGHCVGSYEDEIANETKIVYSLRDPKNRPHVTFNTESVFDEDAAEDAARYEAEEVHWMDRENVLPDVLDQAEEEEIVQASSDFENDHYVEEYMESYDEEDEDGYDNAYDDAQDAFEEAKKEYVQKRVEEARREAEKEWENDWSRYGEDGYVENRVKEMEHHSDYDYRKLRMEQIQGKEDEAPIDRYRPYLREFVESELRHVDMSEVKNRLRPVSEIINGLLTDPKRYAWALSFDDVRRQDLAPYLERVISGEAEIPEDVTNYSMTRVKSEVLKYAIDMMNAGGGERYSNFISSTLESPDAASFIYSISTAKYDPIERLGEMGKRWLLDRLANAEDPREIKELATTQWRGARNIFEEPAWRAALEAAFNRAYMIQQERLEGQEPEEKLSSYLNNDTLPGVIVVLDAILQSLGPGPDFNPQSLLQFSEIMRLLRRREEWLGKALPERKNQYYMSNESRWGNDIVGYVEKILGKVWTEDRDLFSRMVSELPKLMLRDIKHSFMNIRPKIAPHPAAYLNPRVTRQLQLGEQREDFQLKNRTRGSFPEEMMVPVHDRRLEPILYDAIEEGERLRKPDREPESQMQMQFASRGKILRLAAMLEEISPGMADSLERLAISEV